MRKTVSVSAIVFIALALFSINCDKKSEKIEKSKQEGMPAWAMAKLKEQFGIVQFNKHSDQTTNTRLIQHLKIPAGRFSHFQNTSDENVSLASRSVEELAELLNFENTIELTFEDGRICYSIPFSDQPTMSLLVVGDNYVNLEHVERVGIIDYTVDEEGTGTIVTTYHDIEITEIYSAGELVSSESEEKLTEELHSSASLNLCERLKGETFRECFDRGYNTICDGFWGCIAWHTHPAIPVMVATLCSCEKK